MKKTSMISILKEVLTPDEKSKLKLVTEKEVQDYAISRLKKSLFFYKKIESVGVMSKDGRLRPNSNKGMSDIILYIGTKVVNIEIKPLKGSLTYEQIVYLQKSALHCSNVLSVIVASTQGFDKLFDNLTDTKIPNIKNARKIACYNHELNIYI